MKFREWLSNELHCIAARVYDDWHTHEVTTPNGDTITFSCYWQWTGSWPSEWDERCSCGAEDLQ